MWRIITRFQPLAEHVVTQPALLGGRGGSAGAAPEDVREAHAAVHWPIMRAWISAARASARRACR